MEKWEKRWEENQLRWHKSEVDPRLVKHLAALREKENKTAQAQPAPPANSSTETTKKTFFIPLCGKSLDIPYILSLGYHVFGVEGVRKAIETLSEENDFHLELYEQESIFRSPDGRIQIYWGDLFSCPVEKWGPFQYVWDKGSLTAIDEDGRPAYKDVMRRSVLGKGENDFKYLLRTVIYDKEKSDGKGPKCVSERDMEELYGDWANIQLLESLPLPESHVLRKNVNIGLICHENIYLLTRKHNT